MPSPLSIPNLVACGDTRGPAAQYPVVVLLGAQIPGSAEELCLKESDLALLQTEFRMAQALIPAVLYPGFSCDSLKVQTVDGLNFILLEPFTFTALDNGEVITVPEGTTTDGASIPREFWDICPPFGPWWFAAVMHDGAYREYARSNLAPGPIAKARADELLDQGMKARGVHPLIRTVIFECVKLKGQQSYDEDRVAALARIAAAAAAARAGLSAAPGSTVTTVTTITSPPP